MNKNWFVTRLRLAGKTAGDLAEAITRDRAVVSRILNGHQPLTLEHAKAFAQVLGVDVSEVLVEAGLTDKPTATAFRPGFAESDASQFSPKGSDEEKVHLLKRAFGAERTGIDVWKIKSRSMVLNGLMEGDYVLVDLNAAERVKAGDLVVAQIYNNAAGTAVTIVRRFEPPVLVGAGVDDADRRVYVVDGTNVVVKGKIVASWRS